MNKKILLELRSVFGVAHFYVVSEHAEAIHHLTGRKTVHRSDVIALEKLGFEVEIASKAAVRALDTMEKH